MAAVDFFLKIEGVDGESQDKTHKGEIQLDSWSWGETNAGTFAHGGGGGAGKSVSQDFHFVAKTSKASPKLLLFCAGGDHINKAVLTVRKAGKEQQEYLIYTLSDVLVSSYQNGGSGGDVIPMDQFSLNFAQVKIEYKEQKADGTLGGAVTAGYNWKQAAAAS